MNRTPQQLGDGTKHRRSCTNPGRFISRSGWLYLAGFLLSLSGEIGEAVEAALRIGVYATAGDVMRYLAPPVQRGSVLDALRPLRVSRVFLEGRRGDEYVPPQVLRETRDFLATNGIHTSGGIATVPGSGFGRHQDGELGWFNWEDEKTRSSVTGFFAENAPIFDELIVDDFYCTADTSAASDQARGQRSWSQYRRDLLVSLARPIMIDPARAARPGIRLIIKFPQWYDRFHLFGYDPPRMAALFDQVWVGTEVRDPRTRRMGYVQPTEGYMNFRWLASVAGAKTTGAWFDHIECPANVFADQAFMSVLAGARELTLFRLSDLMEGHSGDAVLARRMPELFELAARVSGKHHTGVAFYKPPGSDADDNLYLADYLGMTGLPVFPVAQYPTNAWVVFLPAQAVGDPEILTKVRDHLRNGATVVLTPAFLRRVGPEAGQLAGIQVASASKPETAAGIRIGSKRFHLEVPVEVDMGLRVDGARVKMNALVHGQTVPFLSSREQGRGRVLLLNVRTFSEMDFKAVGEWLLAPLPRGLPEIPPEVADALRKELLEPLRLQLSGPTGIAWSVFDSGQCLYSFRDTPTRVRLSGEAVEVPAHGWLWQE
jgi:hypothetical protein